ncbi:hypothetical protein [Romboutsia lituseburensis]|uniref:hypothetical protein n=1 Tax=Romboutsia lituseburensis TaxID=1537 RepID=UPI0022EAF724|nr:hypothetical protein [Romboutsia lituseburensis]
MISLEGIKINKNNVAYIKVVKRGLVIPPHEDNRSWTIMVKFIDGEHIYIGDYSTQGYAQDRLDEIEILGD